MRARRASALALLAALVPLLTTAPGYAADLASSEVTVTKTVTRAHLVNGHDQVADSRSVTLSVSQTTDVRSQRIAVTWSGAHPTGGIYADQNAPPARNEEYPFVLMECRGTSDDPAVPLSSRLRPESCWTQSFSAERYFESRDPDRFFPPYRVDRYASPTDRQAVVDAAPKCHDDAPVQRWVPFVSASGTTYYGGRTACGGAPPEAGEETTQDRPGNTTYGVTRPDGTGSALFTIWTAQDNASLGCSVDVACSLVAIPIEGISCDVAADGLPAEDRPQPGTEADNATHDCTATGQFQPGATSATGDPALSDQAVTGALWWSASNWRNKIVVPLTFTPSTSVCDVVSNQPLLNVYGSELLSGATTQWAPALCTGPTGLQLKHIQSGEPQARNLLLSGQTSSAFVVDGPPGGYSNPTVSAPTAVTGFAISYSIDDAGGRPYRSLKLTPRLLAKLMTESYPTLPQIKSGASYLSANPLTLLDDPEFRALNPGLAGLTDRDPADGAIISVSSDSDVLTALTSYIEADPEAVSWLDGDPDPWGMTVNRNYQTDRAHAKLSLPTDSWPLLDTYEPHDYYDLQNGALNPCLHDDPVPYLPLVAAPLDRLALVARNIELSLPSATTVCVQPNAGQTLGQKLASPGRQAPGRRFVIGITSLADADRYLLDTAALETNSTVAPTAAVTDSTGRTFVAPTDSALRAAADLATPDPVTGVWRIPYATLRTSAAGASAYPGTLIVSTSVPTAGLPQSLAQDYASLLRFIAGPGQASGHSSGTLPPGYLPITAANGLGALHAYALAAADAVAGQRGQVPALVPATSDGGQTGPPGGSPAVPRLPAARHQPRPTTLVTTPKIQQPDRRQPDSRQPDRRPPVVAAPAGPALHGVTAGFGAGRIALLVPVVTLVLILAGGGTGLGSVLARRRASP